MKRCPCCNSITFDDMDFCYVCMHAFPKNREQLGSVSEVEYSRNRIAALGDISGSIIEDGFDECDAMEHGQAADGCRPDGDSSVDAEPSGWKLEVDIPGFSRFVASLGQEDSRLAVGRSTENGVIVPDLHVSRHHAEFFVDGGRLWIKDCKSMNMTFLNGIPVVGTREVREGSKVRIGCATIDISREPERN